MSLCSKSINFTPSNTCGMHGGGINKVAIYSAVDELVFETFPESSNFTTDYSFDVSSQRSLNVSTITLNFVDANAVNQEGIQNLKGQPLNMVVFMNDGSARIFEGTSAPTKVWMTGLKASSGTKMEDAVEYTLTFTHRSPIEPSISNSNFVHTIRVVAPEGNGWSPWSATSSVTLTVTTANGSIDFDQKPADAHADAVSHQYINCAVTGVGDCHYGNSALASTYSISNGVITVLTQEYVSSTPKKVKNND